MIRILFVGEGAGDIGREHAAEGAYRGDLVEITERVLSSAAAQPKAIRFEHRLTLWNAPGVRIRGARRRQEGLPRGFTAKLERILAVHGEQVDAVVAVVDAGGQGNTRLKQLHEGRREAENQGLPIAYRCAIGVAFQEIEAWLLADDEARRCGFGADVGRRSLKAQPEDIDDIKSFFAELEGQFLAALPDDFDAILIRKAIVDNMRVDEVARRCPQGFARFKGEVEARVAPLFERHSSAPP
jgi:hypothetical protein